MIHNNQSLLYISYSWNFRHRLVRLYWYIYNIYIYIHFFDYHVFIANLYEFVLNSIAVCPVFSLCGDYLMILNGAGDICENSFQVSNQNKSRSNLRVFFSMTKVIHPNHPCWTIFSLKMLLYAKILWMWLFDSHRIRLKHCQWSLPPENMSDFSSADGDGLSSLTYEQDGCEV